MMLKEACSFLSCCLVASVAWSGEPTELFQGTGHDALYGLCLKDGKGIAVGSLGLVVESDDNGSTWNVGVPFTTAALLDVSCGDERARLIVGQEGLIYRWDGSSYQQVESGTDARLLGVAANSSGLAFAVGGFGVVLRSMDGGESWATLSFDWEGILNDFIEPHLYAVHVSDAGIITVVGEFELVLRSTDGGDTWATVHKGEASLFGIDLRDNGGGFAVGQDGTVLQTPDGGLSWNELATPSSAILLDVWSSEQGDVLVSGIRVMLRSVDGGQNWVLVEDGDLKVGWYQSLAVPGNVTSITKEVLLAGHTGRIIKLQLK